MQREIQNGGNENAECSCCLRRRLSGRYGRDDHARNEELNKRRDPTGFSGGIFCLFERIDLFTGADARIGPRVTKNIQRKGLFGLINGGVDVRRKEVCECGRSIDQPQLFFAGKLLERVLQTRRLASRFRRPQRFER